jgi:hypothetical protein
MPTSSALPQNSPAYPSLKPTRTLFLRTPTRKLINGVSLIVMRSRSEYIRPENVAALREETANFKRFKMLMQRWVDLALKASQLRIKHAAK